MNFMEPAPMPDVVRVRKAAHHGHPTCRVVCTTCREARFITVSRRDRVRRCRSCGQVGRKGWSSR